MFALSNGLLRALLKGSMHEEVDVYVLAKKLMTEPGIEI